MLPVIFIGTGVMLFRLRQRADQPDDFDVVKEESKTYEKVVSASAVCEPCEEEEEEEEVKDMTCRFCFMDEDYGPLIAPCGCSGSQEFVHRACLEQWQKVAFLNFGKREHSCRVCHKRFRLPRKPLANRARLWFSLKAKDRLNAYTKVWVQSALSAVNLFRRNKDRQQQPLGMVKPLGMSRSGSAQELAVLLAASEIKIWASREERQGQARLSIIRSLGWFGDALNMINKVRVLTSVL